MKLKLNLTLILINLFLLITQIQSKLKAGPKSSAKTEPINTNTNNNNKQSNNGLNEPNYYESKQIQAYRYVDLDGISFDLHNLYDKDSDYSFNNGKDFFYLNIGDFGVTKCNKDNAYLIYFNRTEINSTDCNLLTGSNKLQVPTWKISSI